MGRAKILVISPVPLDTATDGVKIRGIAVRDGLSALGDITTLNFGNGTDGTATPAPPGPWQRLLSLEPSIFSCFRSMQFRQQVEMSAQDCDLCLLVGLQMSQYVDALPSRTLTVLDNFNVESDILVGLARQRSGLKKVYWLWQAWKLRRYEIAALRKVDLALAISERDATRFRQMAPHLRVLTLPPGLKLEPYLKIPPPEQSFNLVFVGVLDWHVNIDAANWLGREVLPILQSKIAQTTLTIVGRRPTAEVQSLKLLPGVTVHADVESVLPFLQASQVVTVPIRFGSGIQNKVIEGMAAGRPVVTTKVGQDGLDIVPGRDYSLADTTSEFADRCLYLLANLEHCRKMGAQARRVVENNFTYEQLTKTLKASVEPLLGSLLDAPGSLPAGRRLDPRAGPELP